MQQIKSKESLNLIVNAAQNSLIAFARLTHPKYKPNWHHRLLASKLESIAQGELKRLLISMPPRHGKSELASIRFAPWYLGHHPSHNIIQATYAADFAEENAKKSRSIIASQLYSELFSVGLASDSRAVSRWQTNKGGSYYAVGVGGPLTGRGANLLLIDDPHKSRHEAESIIMRKNVWDWFISTAYTRLEDNGAVIVIMTRWHETDLIGCLLNGKEKWDYLCLPAIAEQDEPFRKEGESLWPEKFNLDELKDKKTTIGSREWESQYQQRPSAAEGAILKREYWRYYKELPTTTKIVQSWDTAYKVKKENDYSVCLTFGITKSDFYIIDRWKARVEFPDLRRAVIQKADQFRPNEILIEDKASGQSLIQELRRETNLPIIPIKVDTDKVARANASTGVLEAGKFHLPENAPWVMDFVDTCAMFPAGAHDDDIDSLTQFISRYGFRPKREFLWA